MLDRLCPAGGPDVDGPVLVHGLWLDLIFLLTYVYTYAIMREVGRSQPKKHRPKKEATTMTYNERNLPDAPWVREAEMFGMPDTTDAWERDDPSWGTIYDIVEDEMSDEIPGLVRDYLDGDGDLMMEVYEAGLLADYINPAVKLDDPDTEWNEVDRIFTSEWNNDTLMTAIWDWLTDDHKERIIRGMMRYADTNGLRDLYNEREGE